MKTQRYLLSILALTLACFAGFAIRPALPGSAKASSADPVSVLCTACALLLIRDEVTGQVWAYPRYTSIGNNLVPGDKPTLVGTLTPGQPIK